MLSKVSKSKSFLPKGDRADFGCVLIILQVLLLLTAVGEAAEVNIDFCVKRHV